MDTLLQGRIYLLLLAKNYCPRISLTLQSATVQGLPDRTAGLSEDYTLGLRQKMSMFDFQIRNQIQTP